jgi:hypothetical protein
MTLAGDATKVVVHFIGITAGQVMGRHDPQPAEISSDCGANVGDVFKTTNSVPVNSITRSCSFSHQVLLQLIPLIAKSAVISD